MQKNDRLDSFVAFPRNTFEDLTCGRLTPNEFSVYCYIRIQGNPYGKAYVSFENIRNDVFRGSVSTNRCNQIVLSLKKKGYIDYAPRAGKSGTFLVELFDWILPSKAIKRRHQSTDSELPKDWDADVQNLIDEDTQVKRPSRDGLDTKRLRGAHNDKDKYTDKDNLIIDSKKDESKPIPLSSYKAENYQEARCLDIARALGETDMRFILSVLKGDGFNLVERAYGNVKDALTQDKTGIKNLGAYFNVVVQQLRAENKSLS